MPTDPNPLRRVILESPFAGDEAANIAYGRECLRDSLLRGEAPLASHLLYTQPGVLDDRQAAQREMGTLAGLVWLTVADAAVVYVDNGTSAGMLRGIAAAKAIGVPIEYRRIRK